MEEIKTEQSSVEKLCEDLLRRSKANGVALERMGEQILALQDTIERMKSQKDNTKQGSIPFDRRNRPKTLTAHSDPEAQIF